VILSLFSRKKNAPLTFNERCGLFWEWFAREGERIREAINAKQSQELAAEASKKVDEFLPGFAWVFGPGVEKQEHSFTLSGEGDEHRQILALQWLSLAPKVGNWTFHAARQPGTIRGIKIEMWNLSFDPKEIWVEAVENPESEKIDVTIWHAAWQSLSEQQRWTIIFIFLDEALGEYGTTWWIGEIHFGQNRLADSFPLEELAEFVEACKARNGWTKHLPGDAFTIFKVTDTVGKDEGRPSDAYLWTCAVKSLVREYLEEPGRYEDPVLPFGAEYLFLSIPLAYFPKGKEADKRGELQDVFDEGLRSAGSGRCIGGAFGKRAGYVDFLIFDGEKSLELVRRIAGTLGLPSASALEYFGAGKGRKTLGR